jgi:CHAD domain-containing protein
MRIAAKRLRYALEVGFRCLGGEAEALRAKARELQDVLGEIHDCDVMLPRVAGIESVEALLRARRELLFARFRELWEAEDTRRILRRVDHALRD